MRWFTMEELCSSSVAAREGIDNTPGEEVKARLTELVDEVVAEALRHINRKRAEYHIHVQSSEEYLLAQIDAKLIIQVLINIVDNAIK